MKIGIDARLVAYRRGMGNFIYNFLIELAKTSTRHQYYLYVDRPKINEILPADDRFIIKYLRPSIYPLWEQLALPLMARKDGLDVLYCPANTAPLWLLPPTKLVMTIHDVMYMLPSTLLPLSPSLYQRLGRQYRRWIVPRAAQRSAAIISDSEYSRLDTFQWLALNDKPINVVYGAHSAAYKKFNDPGRIQLLRQKFDLADRIIVTLGAIDPRKNTARVIEAFTEMSRHGYSEHQLVIIGLNDKAKSFFIEQCKRLKIEHNVLMLNFISEEDLITLYNAAEMVVYVSIYEGFGLPVLEAMACGAPVISSNTTSIPEIAEDAALLVSPTSIKAIADAMMQLADDDRLRQNLILKGRQQASKFSWQRATQETLSIIEAIDKI